MQDYLMRALGDDISPSKLMNVIRIITGKSIIVNGVSGEENHFAQEAKAKKALEVEPEENEVEESVEIDEILSSYIKKE